MTSKILLWATALGLGSSISWADGDGSIDLGAAAHAPIGVMGEHLHKQAEVMLSYRFMAMQMDGNRSGSDTISNEEIWQDYRVAPQHMRMDMHMFGAMYAPTDDLTLSAMLPYQQRDMTLQMRPMPMMQMNQDMEMNMGGGMPMMNGARFSTSSDGIGDFKVASIYRLRESPTGGQWLLNLGLSLPTGKINHKDDTPMGEVILPYAMQTGSGTLDLLAGITYNRYRQDISWGAQLSTVSRFYDNYRNYRLGNRQELGSWISKSWNPANSSSLRLQAQHWGDVKGADQDLNPAMVPTANPEAQGGQRINALIGHNYLFRSGLLQDHRLAIEASLPLYEDLHGPQMSADWSLTLGWQKAF